MEMTNPPQIRVVVDDREADNPVVVALRQSPGVELLVRRLPVGDYLVDDRCVFERKTVVDFALSIVDGRLFSQARKLASLLEPAALILEGRPSDLAQTRIRREALQGAMVSLSLIFHLPVLRAVDSAETARLILYAAQQLRRHDAEPGHRHLRRPKQKRRIQLRILQGLPGIGPARAKQLLERFATVEAVMTAPQHHLEQVTGIGEKTAAAVRDALRETPLPYRAADEHGIPPLANVKLSRPGTHSVPAGTAFVTPY